MPSIAVIVLAAGRSRRFECGNKLFSSVGGKPLLTRALQAASDSNARPVIVVSGYQQARLLRVLCDFRRGCRKSVWLRTTFNRAYQRGMAGSLIKGISAVPQSCAGAVICLGDMPEVTAAMIDALIAAYRSGDSAVVPIVDGQRGNPVLLAQEIFASVRRLEGDHGARRLLTRLPHVREFKAGASALRDIDTHRDWLAFTRRRQLAR